MANRSDLDVYVNGHDNLTPSLNRTLSSVIRWVGAVSSALAAAEVVAFPVKSIREFEREMANVQKTTQFSDQEIRQLSGSLKDLSTRIDISATDLAKIAAAAGQQGLGREGVQGIVQFTDSVSRMSSVLDISVDEAGLAVGKLSSIFNIPLTETEKLASAFNEVANNSTATGEQLIDVVRRVGDAAGAFKSYADTLGVASTAIDFGVSPEVAGTSITKIFADMQGKAAKFAAFMNTSVDDWINRIQTDGVKAFKDYLDRLRDLDGASRQATIRELSGTGRIGALLNKFVNDTTNTILNRNLASAYRGLNSGTSALREQETVMKTLDAQIKITQNAFRNLGVTAGDQFAKPLASMMAELTDAFKNPAVVSFAESVGKAFLDVFHAISEGIKYVSSLNVNWENFIRLAVALTAIKAAEWAVSFIARLTGLNRVLQSTAKQAAETAAAVDNATKAGAANSASGQIAALRQLSAERAKYKAAIDAQKAAEEALAATEAARAAAVSRQNAAFAGRQNAYQAVSPQASAVSAAQAAAVAAQANIQRATEAAQRAMNTRIEQAEAQHQARLAEIEQQYQARRQAAKAAGNNAEIRALRAARTEAIAAEEASYERSLRAINAYHTRRIAAVTAEAQQEAAIRAQALVQAQAGYGQAANAAGVTAQAAALRQASAEVDRLNKEVAAAKGNLDTAAAGAAAAGAAFNRFGNILATVRAGITLLFRVLGGAFFWGTIIYTFADMFGLIDKLGPAFTKLTDAIGLTSESQRKLNQEAKEANDRLIEQQKTIDDHIDKYKKLQDAMTGQLRPEDVAALPTILGGENRDAAARALDDVLTTIRGATELIQQNQSKLKLLPDQRAEKAQELAQIESQYTAAMQRMQAASAKLSASQLQQINNPNEAQAASAITPAMRSYAAAKREVEELTKSLEAAKAAAGSIGDGLKEGLEKQIRSAQQDLSTLAPVVAGLFTEQSAGIFTEYAAKLADLREQIAKVSQARAESIQEQVKASDKGQEAIDAQKAKTEELTNTLTTLNGQLQTQTQNALDQIDKLSKQPGVSPELLNSLQYLRVLLSLSADDTRTLLTSLNDVSKAGVALTGSNAPKPPRSSTGTQSYSAGGDSSARREAKARLALLKAQHKAEADLEKQANEERLRDLEHTNQQGLIAIQDFYKRKQAIQLADNAKAIELAKLEREGVAKEVAAAKDAASRINAQASLARLDGEIKALQQQRGFIQNQINRDQADALREFTDRLGQESLKLSEFLGGTEDSEFFRQALSTYEADYREFLNRLRAQSATMPELLPMIDKIELQLRFQAVGNVFSQISKETDLASGSLDRYATRLGLLQQRGVLTTGDLAKAMDGVRRSQIALAQEGLERMEAQLSGLPKESLAFKELSAQIDETRLRMQTLKAESNAVAKEINDGFKNALSDAFTNFKLGDNLGDTLLGILGQWLQTLQGVLGRALAENIMQGINGGIGGDGIGGFFANLFGMSDTLSQPGSSPTNPLYTVNARDPLGGLGDISKGFNIFGGGSDDPLGDFIKSLDETPGKITQGIAEGAGGLTSGLGGIFDSFLGGASGLFDSLLNGMGSLFSSLSGLFSGGGSGMWGALFQAAAVAHSGAIVGRGGGARRNVPIGLFHGAARFHSGAAGVGLKPDEVAAVLQKGEEVLSRNDPRNALNGGLSGNGDVSAKPQVNLRVVPVLDPAVVPDAMSSSAGEQVVMVHIQKNASRIKQMLK